MIVISQQAFGFGSQVWHLDSCWYVFTSELMMTLIVAHFLVHNRHISCLGQSPMHVNFTCNSLSSFSSCKHVAHCVTYLCDFSRVGIALCCN